jgi:hypothetical protein
MTGTTAIETRRTSYRVDTHVRGGVGLYNWETPYAKYDEVYRITSTGGN